MKIESSIALRSDKDIFSELRTEIKFGKDVIPSILRLKADQRRAAGENFCDGYRLNLSDPKQLSEFEANDPGSNQAGLLVFKSGEKILGFHGFCPNRGAMDSNRSYSVLGDLGDSKNFYPVLQLDIEAGAHWGPNSRRQIVILNALQL